MIIQIATIFLLALTNANAELEEIAGWRFLTFALPEGFPGASPFGYPVYSENTSFTGLQATEDRFILAMPRFGPGVPITLGWVPRPPPGTRLPVDTPIQAFPDWDWHWAAANGPESASTNCSALVSVFRSRLDRCGRLWVLDSGVWDTVGSFSVVCPPKLLAFDPTTGQVLRRIEIKRDVLQINSLLTNMALDSRSAPGSSCSDPDDIIFYLSDATAPGIVVYDLRSGTAWRHSAPQMYPDPDKGIFTVAGESFELMDGIIGLTLSNPFVLPASRPGSFYSERILYFQAYASDRIYSILASALLAKPKPNEQLPIKLVGHKSSQGAPIRTDPTDDSIIFPLISEYSIVNWIPAQNTLRLLAYDPIRLQVVADINVEPEQIFAISTRSQKFRHKTATLKEVNLRILRIRKAPKYRSY